MPIQFLRKYGEAGTVDFSLFKIDGIDFRSDATFAAGDLKIMKDEGNEASTTNLPTDEGQGYSLVLTDTEMTCKRVVVYIVDQTSPKVWLDDCIIIETYGHASAMHCFNLDFDLSAANETLKLKHLEITNTAGPGLKVTGSSGYSGLECIGVGSGAGASFTGGTSGHGLYAIGGGVGSGAELVGGASGAGASFIGGSSAPGANFTGGSTGNGVVSTGGAGKHGLYLQGGTTGCGLLSIGGLTGDGMRVEAGPDGNGNGFSAQGQSDGIYAYSQDGASGMYLQGDGVGSGLYVAGGLTGIGAEVEGGATSGIGLKISTTNGIGVSITSAGVTKHGLLVTSYGGEAVHIAALNGSNSGISIKGNEYGSGCLIAGGADGNGLTCLGGETSGNGIFTNALDGSGLYCTSGAGPAVHFVSQDINDYAHGLLIQSAGATAVRIEVTNPSSGHGLHISAFGAGCHGIYSQGSNGGSGIVAEGEGAGNGVTIKAGSSGQGIDISGGSLSGNGIYIHTISGHGVYVDTKGTGQSGLRIINQSGDCVFVYGGAGNAVALQSGGIGMGLYVSSVEGPAVVFQANRAAQPGLRVVSSASIGGAPGAEFIGYGGPGISVLGVGAGISGLLLRGNVTGKDLDAKEIQTLIDGQEPMDILNQIVDSDLTVKDALALAAASVSNRYEIDKPDEGNMTIYKRNNVTVLTVLDVKDTGRTRIS